MWQYKETASCAICSSSLEELWFLPRLPFTEKYGRYDPQHNLFMDQSLLGCPVCGHVQLKKQISPQILYTPSEYSFRTAQSFSAKAGTDFFYNFFRKTAQEKSFQVFLDVGGNDLYLAKKLNKQVPKRYVIDPVCQANDGEVIEGVHVIGKFIEDVSLSMKPDLVFCRHVLEHLANPKEILQKLFSECDEKALFIFEVPCFEHLMRASRWDAIFHQHYHYFYLDSFKRLLLETGGKYLDHVYNEQGSCGGSLLIAFQKINKSVAKAALKRVDLTAYKDSIEKYELFMNRFSEKLKIFKKDVYGYGASLMLATLAYHLKTDLSELICILDEDEQKNGWEYQNLPVKVCHPKNEKQLLQANFMITSLENNRLIYQKLLSYSPKNILLPCIN